MIAVSPGHYPASPGAAFAGVSEHELAVEWMAEVVALLRMKEPVYLTVPGPLQNKVAWLNALEPQPVLACEIHFNSDPLRKGRGSETLYAPRSMLGGMAARIVQGHLGSVMSPNRGIKEGWHRMDRPGHVDYPGDVEGDENVDYFLKATRCPAIIVEPEFIHSREALQKWRLTACRAIADGLFEASVAIRRELSR